MRLFVAVTDYDYLRLHAAKPTMDEVNFWKPRKRMRRSELTGTQPSRLPLTDIARILTDAEINTPETLNAALETRFSLRGSGKEDGLRLRA